MTNLEDWIDRVSRHLGVDDAVNPDVVRDLTLDLARDVAHAVERRAAPVTTYLLGLAAGRSDDPMHAATEHAATIRGLLDNLD